MDSYKMEHPMYEFLCEKKTHYKTRFSQYTHGMIDIQELRLYVNLILHTVSVFYVFYYCCPVNFETAHFMYPHPR